MKNKNILNLFNFGIIFMLFSCEKNLYEDAIYKSGINVNYVNSIALKNNVELMKTLNIKKILKTNLEGRIINDSVNGFSIDTEMVKYLTSGNFHSYTFEVLEKQPGKLDNLVLMSQSDGTYAPYYVSYTLTDAEMETINSTSPIDFSNKSKVLRLTNINIISNFFSKIEVNCNMNYTWQEVVEITPCQIDGCWDPEWTGTRTNHVLVGTLQCSTDQINDILGTSPVNGGVSGISGLPQNPCIKLKGLFDPTKANIKPIVNSLLLSIPNTNGENGETFEKNSNGVYSSNTLTQSNNNSLLSKSAGGNFFGKIHTHPLDVYPMFSWSDVNELNIINNHLAPQNQGSAVSMLATIDDNGVNQLYAIVIEENSISTIDDVLNNPQNIGCTNNEIESLKNDELGETYRKEYNSVTNPNYELAFLKQMYGLNVSLYKANAGLNNWSKLKINQSTGNITTTPCN
jgi:hypothetical protein